MMILLFFFDLLKLLLPLQGAVQVLKIPTKFISVITTTGASYRGNTFWKVVRYTTRSSFDETSSCFESETDHMGLLSLYEWVVIF